MNLLKHFFLRQAFALCAGMLMASTALAGVVSWNVSVDTQSLAGSSGYLDFGLNGLLDSPAAQLGISGLSGGSSNGAAVLDGDVAAQAGGWLLGNGGAFNAVFQPWSFGSVLNFRLDFSGDWLSAASGSGNTFAFKLWDESGLNLLTSDAFGDLLRIELNPGGQSDVVRFDQDAAGTPSAVTISQAGNSVPEPGSVVLLMCALSLLALRRMRG